MTGGGSFLHGGSYTPSPMPKHFSVPGLKTTSSSKRRRSGLGGGGARGANPPSSFFKPGGAFSKARFAGVRVPSSSSGSSSKISPYGSSSAGGLKVAKIKPIKIGGTRGTGMPKSGISPTHSSSPYVRSMHAGSSQSTGAVRKHGLVWGGAVFHTRSAFSHSLAAHGANIASFQKKHGAAYNGLLAAKAKPKF